VLRKQKKRLRLTVRAGRTADTRKRKQSGLEPAGKPGSVEDNHSSGTAVTDRLKRPTRKSARTTVPRRERRGHFPIWSCSRWGLPCHSCCQLRGALLPHHFTLTAGRNRWRYIFCGTFRGLAPPRRYLAPCPQEPGLSSRSLSERAIVWPAPAGTIKQRGECDKTVSRDRTAIAAQWRRLRPAGHP